MLSLSITVKSQHQQGKELSGHLWTQVIHAVGLSRHWAFPPVRTKTFLCFHDGGSKPLGIKDVRLCRALHLKHELKSQPVRVWILILLTDSLPQAGNFDLSGAVPILAFTCPSLLARKTNLTQTRTLPCTQKCVPTGTSVVSHPVVSNSLWPHGQQPARFLCPRDSPGKNTGVGFHFLL